MSTAVTLFMALLLLNALNASLAPDAQSLESPPFAAALFHSFSSVVPLLIEKFALAVKHSGATVE